MIVAKLIGGLGNQMFQYAFARNLSIELNRELLIDISAFNEYKLHDFALLHFNINSKLIEKFHYDITGPNLKSIQILKERSLLYQKDLKINNSKDIIYLDGYWQSENYFKKNVNVIISDLRIISSLSDLDKEIINLINKTTIPVVSMHIRRGDYVANSVTNEIHGTCSIDYYKRAFNVMKNKLSSEFLVIIFSDDFEWVKNNFDFIDNSIFCDHNDSKTNFADLYLMNLCNHNIIANSSFSWWGAYSNLSKNKIVIAPAIWFKDFDMNLTSMNIVPENWIRV
jgi:hypothetical protein